jgi:TRAP-type C4-dicarboxylate transport system permease small subunit
MRDAFLRFHDGYGRAQAAVALLAGICTFFIMLLIVANALTRKMFNVPVPASLEITQALLVAVIMLPFAYTQLRREHVNTTFFMHRLSRAAQRRLTLFWMICGCLLFAAVTYGTFQYAMRSYNMKEQIWGATIQFSVWPAKMAVSAGTLLLAIQFLLDAVHTVLTGGDHAIEVELSESQVHV